MAVDNTHTKYLHGGDKKAWNNYKEALETQKKLDSFMGKFDLKEGEEYDVPINKNRKKK